MSEIRIRRGPASQLPVDAALGEPLYTTDEGSENLYIGNGPGVMPSKMSGVNGEVQAALDMKANSADVDSALDDKADKTLIPWVDSSQYSTLAAADAAAVASGRRLVIAKQWNTVPPTLNAHIAILPGGSLNNAGSVTFTKQPDIGWYQVFIGSGTVTGFNKARVEWFGGRGDGAVDNSAAILKALASTGYSRQADIEFQGDGDYLVNTSTVISGYSNKRFMGNGATISTTSSIAVMEVNNAQNIRFDSLNFVDSSVDYTNYSLLFTDTTPPTKNGHVFHTASVGLYLHGYADGQGVSGVDVDNCSFTGFKWGLQGYGNGTGHSAPITDVHVSRSRFSYNYAGMVTLGYQVVNGIGSCQNWAIDGKTVFDRNWHWGVWQSSGDSTPNSYFVQNFKFIGVDFLNTYEEHGIYAQGRNHQIIGCTFRGNNSAGIRSYGIPGALISGNTFEENGKNLNSPQGPTNPTYDDVGQGYRVAALMIGADREPGYTETYEGVGIGVSNNRFYNNYAGIQLYCDKLRPRIIGNEVFSSTATGLAGIDLMQVGEAIVSGNTSSSNAADGMRLTSYGGAGSYSGRSDYASIFGNTIMGNAGYGLNIPSGASNFFKLGMNTINSNALGDRNIVADSKNSEQAITLVFSGAIPTTANTTTTLDLNGVAGVNNFRAFGCLNIKGITYQISSAPSAGGITVQPLRDGGVTGMGTGPLFHNAGGARVYPTEGGLGYVLTTENLSLSATTSSDYANGSVANIVVVVTVGYSPTTYYGTDYSVEKVTNGAFAADANWNKGTGPDWVISGGAASTTSNGGASSNDLFQSFALVTGRLYKVVFTVNSVSGGGVSAEVLGNTGSGPSTGKGTNRTTPGTYTETITAGTGSYFRIHATAGTTGSVSAVSVTEVLN